MINLFSLKMLRVQVKLIDKSSTSLCCFQTFLEFTADKGLSSNYQEGSLDPLPRMKAGKTSNPQKNLKPRAPSTPFSTPDHNNPKPRDNSNNG